MTLKEVGAVIRDARKREGLTQDELAAIVGLASYRPISGLENGHINSVRPDMLDRIAQYLRVSFCVSVPRK